MAVEDKAVSSRPSSTFWRLCKPWSASWNLALRRDGPRPQIRDVAPKVLKSREAAAYLGVSQWTLRNFVHDGLLEYLPGKHWRFSTDDLDEHIRRNREKEPAL